MKFRAVGLRVSGVLIALISLGLIARLWARSEIVIGSHHFGPVRSMFFIIITGGIGIWLTKLAGPWCTETKGKSTPGD